jgi:hypothetical protein
MLCSHRLSLRDPGTVDRIDRDLGRFRHLLAIRWSTIPYWTGERQRTKAEPFSEH